MNELRDSILSLGVADPETAVAIHAALGGDPADVSRAGALPQRLDDMDEWVKDNFLKPDSPFFEAAASAVADALGEAPDDAVDKILADVNIRPRTVHDLRLSTGLAEADLDAILPGLAEAGLLRAETNPLDLDHPFWTMNSRLARFSYAMIDEHLPRWRRGYITDTLWRMTRARYDRYVSRPEFQRLAREWALNDPAAIATTRITVPDPRFRQMRTLELAVWGEEDRLLALGTVRWKFKMVERQLKRLRHVQRLLGDPPSRLYCIAPRFEAAIAGDPDPRQFAITPAQLLRVPRPRPETAAAEAPATAPDGD
ncbi:hypothetical protein [Glycomyces paridis]|uniref:Uncharacterized protein n=1 Tax=Glycomyces paridis TaxID=2126555 RepID=A0A4V4HP61_9ACTN|nr:hypothetical protein [Glycomyces paridis]THV28416.1 hypothetical protein E9998_12495 [Glycomyces paridis]